MKENFIKTLSGLKEEELEKLLLLAVKKHRIDIQVILDWFGTEVGDERFGELIAGLKPG